MSDNDCSPELEITSRKGIVVIKSLVSIDALGSKVLPYPQWKASQTLELKDQNINQGTCAKKDPISCFTSGATGKTLTTKNTVTETSISAGSYFRFGPERMVMEMNLTKTSKSLYYSMKFKHRDPSQNLNQTTKMSCYYEQM
jgi:hypothetical protein